MIKIKLLILTVLTSLNVISVRASTPEYIALADSADNYIKEERWSDAEKTIRKALRLEPGNFTNSLLLSNLGVVQTQQGLYDDALESFRLGLSIAPKSSVLYNNRARTLLHLNRYDEALSDLNKSLNIDSIQEWPLQMRGFILLNKNLEAAKNDFITLGNRFPKNSSAMTGLAAVAEKEERFDDALKYYNEALILEENPDIRFSRILLKINIDKYSEASADISEAISRYPDTGEFYLLRGLLKKLNFRYDEANVDKKIALDKGADKQLVEQILP